MLSHAQLLERINGRRGLVFKAMTMQEVFVCASPEAPDIPYRLHRSS